jgi:hypothetical protein
MEGVREAATGSCTAARSVAETSRALTEVVERLLRIIDALSGAGDVRHPPALSGSAAMLPAAAPGHVPALARPTDLRPAPLAG